MQGTLWRNPQTSRQRVHPHHAHSTPIPEARGWTGATPWAWEKAVGLTIGRTLAGLWDKFQGCGILSRENPEASSFPGVSAEGLDFLGCF